MAVVAKLRAMVTTMPTHAGHHIVNQRRLHGDEGDDAN
jgi:hypothetical protein